MSVFAAEPVLAEWVIARSWDAAQLGAVIGLAAVAAVVAGELAYKRSVTAPVFVAALVAAQTISGASRPAVAAVAIALGLALALGGATGGPLALASVAAAATPGLLGPSLLLAAAAVLVAVLDRNAAAVCALPGLAAAAVLADSGQGSAQPWLVLAGLALLAVIVAGQVDWPNPVEPHLIPAVIAAAWLTLAPSTWSFASTRGLGPYSRAAPLAAAVAGLVAVSTTIRSHHQRLSDSPPQATPED